MSSKVKVKLLEPGTVSAHVRHGFKLWEAKLFEFEAIPGEKNSVIWGFPWPWGIPKFAGWFIINGNSQTRMDDDWGYPHFRKPPYEP